MSARMVQLGEDFDGPAALTPDGWSWVAARSTVTICTEFVDPGHVDRLSPDWRKHCARCGHAEWKHAAVLTVVEGGRHG